MFCKPNGYYAGKALNSKSVLQGIHIKTEFASRKRISKQNFLQYYLDNEFNEIHSSRIAQNIIRYINNTRSSLRDTRLFVESTIDKILFLHNYNLKVAEVTFKYPLTTNLEQLLLRYVVLECKVLYKKEYYTASYETLVKNRMLRLLLNVFQAHLECSNTVSSKKIFKECCRYILKLLIKVKVQFDVHNDLMEVIARKLLRRTGEFKQIKALAKKSIPCPLDTYLHDSELAKSYKNITSDYGTDTSTDLTVDEDSELNTDEVVTCNDKTDATLLTWDMQKDIKDLLQLSKTVSLRDDYTIKMVPTICLDDDLDSTTVCFQKEVRTSSKCLKWKEDEDKRLRLLREKKSKLLWNHKPIIEELSFDDEEKPDVFRVVKEDKKDNPTDEVIVLDDDDDEDDVENAKNPPVQSNTGVLTSSTTTKSSFVSNIGSSRLSESSVQQLHLGHILPELEEKDIKKEYIEEYIERVHDDSLITNSIYTQSFENNHVKATTKERSIESLRKSTSAQVSDSEVPENSDKRNDINCTEIQTILLPVEDKVNISTPVKEDFTFENSVINELTYDSAEVYEINNPFQKKHRESLEYEEKELEEISIDSCIDSQSTSSLEDHLISYTKKTECDTVVENSAQENSKSVESLDATETEENNVLQFIENKSDIDDSVLNDITNTNNEEQHLTLELEHIQSSNINEGTNSDAELEDSIAVSAQKCSILSDSVEDHNVDNVEMVLPNLGQKFRPNQDNLICNIEASNEIDEQTLIQYEKSPIPDNVVDPEETLHPDLDVNTQNEKTHLNDVIVSASEPENNLTKENKFESESDQDSARGESLESDELVKELDSDKVIGVERFSQENKEENRELVKLFDLHQEHKLEIEFINTVVTSNNDKSQEKTTDVDETSVIENNKIETSEETTKTDANVIESVLEQPNQVLADFPSTESNENLKEVMLDKTKDACNKVSADLKDESTSNKCISNTKSKQHCLSDMGDKNKDIISEIDSFLEQTDNHQILKPETFQIVEPQPLYTDANVMQPVLEHCLTETDETFEADDKTKSREITSDGNVVESGLEEPKQICSDISSKLTKENICNTYTSATELEQNDTVPEPIAEDEEIEFENETAKSETSLTQPVLIKETNDVCNAVSSDLKETSASNQYVSDSESTQNLCIPDTGDINKDVLTQIDNFLGLSNDHQTKKPESIQFVDCGISETHNSVETTKNNDSNNSKSHLSPSNSPVGIPLSTPESLQVIKDLENIEKDPLNVLADVAYILQHHDVPDARDNHGIKNGKKPRSKKKPKKSLTVSYTENKRLTRSARTKNAEPKLQIPEHKCKPHDFVIVDNTAVPPPANNVYIHKLQDNPLTSDDSNDSDGHLLIDEGVSVKTNIALDNLVGEQSICDEDSQEENIMFICEPKETGTVLISIPDTNQENFDILDQMERLSCSSELILPQNSKTDVTNHLSTNNTIFGFKTFRTKAQQKNYDNDKFSLTPYVSIERLNITFQDKERKGKHTRSKSFDIGIIRNIRGDDSVSNSSLLAITTRRKSTVCEMKDYELITKLTTSTNNLPNEAEKEKKQESQIISSITGEESEDDIPLLHRTKLMSSKTALRKTKTSKFKKISRNSIKKEKQKKKSRLWKNKMRLKENKNSEKNSPTQKIFEEKTTSSRSTPTFSVTENAVTTIMIQNNQQTYEDIQKIAKYYTTPKLRRKSVGHHNLINIEKTVEEVKPNSNSSIILSPPKVRRKLIVENSTTPTKDKTSMEINLLPTNINILSKCKNTVSPTTEKLKRKLETDFKLYSLNSEIEETDLKTPKDKDDINSCEDFTSSEKPKSPKVNASNTSSCKENILVGKLKNNEPNNKVSPSSDVLKGTVLKSSPDKTIESVVTKLKNNKRTNRRGSSCNELNIASVVNVSKSKMPEKNCKSEKKQSVKTPKKIEPLSVNADVLKCKSDKGNDTSVNLLKQSKQKSRKSNNKQRNINSNENTIDMQDTHNEEDATKTTENSRFDKPQLENAQVNTTPILNDNNLQLKNRKSSRSKNTNMSSKTVETVTSPKSVKFGSNLSTDNLIISSSPKSSSTKRKNVEPKKQINLENLITHSKIDSNSPFNLNESNVRAQAILDTMEETINSTEEPNPEESEDRGPNVSKEYVVNENLQRNEELISDDSNREKQHSDIAEIQNTESDKSNIANNNIKENHIIPQLEVCKVTIPLENVPEIKNYLSFKSSGENNDGVCINGSTKNKDDKVENNEIITEEDVTKSDHVNNISISSGNEECILTEEICGNPEISVKEFEISCESPKKQKAVDGENELFDDSSEANQDADLSLVTTDRSIEKKEQKVLPTLEEIKTSELQNKQLEAPFKSIQEGGLLEVENERLLNDDNKNQFKEQTELPNAEATHDTELQSQRSEVISERSQEDTIEVKNSSLENTENKIQLEGRKEDEKHPGTNDDCQLQNINLQVSFELTQEAESINAGNLSFINADTEDKSKEQEQVPNSEVVNASEVHNKQPKLSSESTQETNLRKTENLPLINSNNNNQTKEQRELQDSKVTNEVKLENQQSETVFESNRGSGLIRVENQNQIGNLEDLQTSAADVCQLQSRQDDASFETTRETNLIEVKNLTFVKLDKINSKEQNEQDNFERIICHELQEKEHKTSELIQEAGLIKDENLPAVNTYNENQLTEQEFTNSDDKQHNVLSETVQEATLITVENLPDIKTYNKDHLEEQEFIKFEAKLPKSLSETILEADLTRVENLPDVHTCNNNKLKEQEFINSEPNNECQLQNKQDEAAPEAIQERDLIKVGDKLSVNTENKNPSKESKNLEVSNQIKSKMKLKPLYQNEEIEKIFGKYLPVQENSKTSSPALKTDAPTNRKRNYCSIQELQSDSKKLKLEENPSSVAYILPTPTIENAEYIQPTSQAKIQRQQNDEEEIKSSLTTVNVDVDLLKKKLKEKIKSPRSLLKLKQKPQKILRNNGIISHKNQITNQSEKVELQAFQKSRVASKLLNNTKLNNTTVKAEYKKIDDSNFVEDKNTEIKQKAEYKKNKAAYQVERQETKVITKPEEDTKSSNKDNTIGIKEDRNSTTVTTEISGINNSKPKDETTEGNNYNTTIVTEAKNISTTVTTEVGVIDKSQTEGKDAKVSDKHNATGITEDKDIISATVTTDISVTNNSKPQDEDSEGNNNCNTISVTEVKDASLTMATDGNTIETRKQEGEDTEVSTKYNTTGITKEGNDCTTLTINTAKSEENITKLEAKTDIEAAPVNDVIAYSEECSYQDNLNITPASDVKESNISEMVPSTEVNMEIHDFDTNHVEYKTTAQDKLIISEMANVLVPENKSEIILVDNLHTEPTNTVLNDKNLENETDKPAVNISSVDNIAYNPNAKTNNEHENPISADDQFVSEVSKIPVKESTSTIKSIENIVTDPNEITCYGENLEIMKSKFNGTNGGVDNYNIEKLAEGSSSTVIVKERVRDLENFAESDNHNDKHVDSHKNEIQEIDRNIAIPEDIAITSSSVNETEAITEDDISKQIVTGEVERNQENMEMNLGLSAINPVKFLESENLSKVNEESGIISNSIENVDMVDEPSVLASVTIFDDKNINYQNKIDEIKSNFQFKDNLKMVDPSLVIQSPVEHLKEPENTVDEKSEEMEINNSPLNESVIFDTETLTNPVIESKSPGNEINLEDNINTNAYMMNNPESQDFTNTVDVMSEVSSDIMSSVLDSQEETKINLDLINPSLIQPVPDQTVYSQNVSDPATEKIISESESFSANVEEANLINICDLMLEVDGSGEIQEPFSSGNVCMLSDKLTYVTSANSINLLKFLVTSQADIKDEFIPLSEVAMDKSNGNEKCVVTTGKMTNNETENYLFSFNGHTTTGTLTPSGISLNLQGVPFTNGVQSSELMTASSMIQSENFSNEMATNSEINGFGGPLFCARSSEEILSNDNQLQELNQLKKAIERDLLNLNLCTAFAEKSLEVLNHQKPSTSLSEYDLTDIKRINLIEDTSISNTEENSNSLDTGTCPGNVEQETKDISDVNPWAQFITGDMTCPKVVVLQNECLNPSFSVDQNDIIHAFEDSIVETTVETSSFIDDALSKESLPADIQSEEVTKELLDAQLNKVSSQQEDVNLKKVKKQEKTPKVDQFNEDSFPKRRYTRTRPKAPSKKNIISPLKAEKETQNNVKQEVPVPCLNEPVVESSPSSLPLNKTQKEVKHSFIEPTNFNPEFTSLTDLLVPEHVSNESTVGNSSKTDLLNLSNENFEKESRIPPAIILETVKTQEVIKDIPVVSPEICEPPKMVDDSLESTESVSKVNSENRNIADLVKERKRTGVNKYLNSYYPSPTVTDVKPKQTEKLSSAETKTPTLDVRQENEPAKVNETTNNSAELSNDLLKTNNEVLCNIADLVKARKRSATNRYPYKESYKYQQNPSQNISLKSTTAKLPSDKTFDTDTKLKLNKSSSKTNNAQHNTTMPQPCQSNSQKCNYSVESILSKESRTNGFTTTTVKISSTSKRNSAKRALSNPRDDEVQKKQLKTDHEEIQSSKNSIDATFDSLLQQGNVNKLINLRVTEDNKLKTERRSSPFLKANSRPKEVDGNTKPERKWSPYPKKKQDDVDRGKLERKGSPLVKPPNKETDMIVNSPLDKLYEKSGGSSYSRQRSNHTQKYKEPETNRRLNGSYRGRDSYNMSRGRDPYHHDKSREGYHSEHVSGRENQYPSQSSRSREEPEHNRGSRHFFEPSTSSNTSRTAGTAHFGSGRSSNVSAAYYKTSTSEFPQNNPDDANDLGPYTKRSTKLSGHSSDALYRQAARILLKTPVSNFRESSNDWEKYSWIDKVKGQIPDAYLAPSDNTPKFVPQPSSSSSGRK